MNNMTKISVCVMTYNEIANIDHCLKSIPDTVAEILVVDSFSTDGTAEFLMATSEIKYFSRKFINWADQRNFLAAQVDADSTHVLFLDADEQLTPRIIDEINDLKLEDVDAANFNFEYHFLGRTLKYAYGHPRVRRLFRKSLIEFRSEGAREYSTDVPHEVKINQSIVHKDNKGIDEWLAKHIKNSSIEATFNVNSTNHILTKHEIWRRLPLVWRCIPYFLYRYFFKLAFLDGWQGFVYTLLHSAWYRIVIDVKILEATNNDE
jgi:glycosyltransferase involved in cell wall biosynthesis